MASAVSGNAATCATVRIPSRWSLSGGHGTDAPEPLDRQGVEERELTLGRDDEQAVRLRHGACHLREKLRPCHSDRDRQADLLAHVPTELRGDLARAAGEPLHSACVQEGLVDRKPLDERRRVFEHAEDCLARLGVGLHPRPYDDGVRAEPQGAPPAHRGPDSERLRFVARREHDPAADDHRTPPESRVVALLDGREERVEVGVQDRRRAMHEHMFVACDSPCVKL